MSDIIQSIPLRSHAGIQCVLISFVFEVLRIIIAYLVAKPSDLIRKKQQEKLQTNIELSEIKSVQLEFVRHSLLTRKVIKIDKDIEKLNEDYAPRAVKAKFYSRITRLIVYIAVGIYFGNKGLVLVHQQLIWPLSFFTNETMISLNAIALLCLCGLSWRHAIRTMLPIMFRKASFP